MLPFSGVSIVSGLFFTSMIVNILALTSPLFMLQVYDRVLASGSVPTLVGLAVLAIGLYLLQALLDIIRSRVLLRIGENFNRRHSFPVHSAIVRLPLTARVSGDGLQPMRDLDNVRNFLSGSGLAALFDLPWIPLYLTICFMFHFWLGVTALFGAIVLISLTLLTNALSQNAIRETANHNMARNAIMEASRRNAEVVRAMGLEHRLFERWQKTNAAYLFSNRRAGDVTGGLGGLSKALRIILQSAILGVGAYLVITHEATAGVMIAASIMMGRALAPVDMAIANWKQTAMARQSWTRLTELLKKLPPAPELMDLPAPCGELRVEDVAIVPPGEKRPTVAGVNFTVRAGSAVGVIGPSGSGKTSVARILVGAWPCAAGKVRLDGSSLDHWNAQVLGRHIGYLPQGAELFDGTIADNIARFDVNPDPLAIIAAAKTAGVHDLITSFEKGYQTLVGEGGSALSSGQRQRIGLARALYGDPFLVVLDEPNANLDAEGEAAVVKAIASIRERNGIAIVVAHRPSAISVVDQILVMENGRQRVFGPKESVLSRVLRVAPQPSQAPQQPALQQDSA